LLPADDFIPSLLLNTQLSMDMTHAAAKTIFRKSSRSLIPGRLTCPRQPSCSPAGIPARRHGEELVFQLPGRPPGVREADQALAFPISRLCFDGPEEDLKLTHNTQPALLTVSAAAMRVLRENRMEPDFVAGHSLGEYSALVAAGSLGLADAVRLVRQRGMYMQEAVPVGVGAMAALLKLPEGKLDEVLRQAAQGDVVSTANLNSPDQVVIAGHAVAVARAVELAKAAGARRAVLLPVSAPFHCSLMKPAQERLGVDLEATQFADLRFPLINNWQAREIRTGAEAREGLYQQVRIPSAGPRPFATLFRRVSTGSWKSARAAFYWGCCADSIRPSKGTSLEKPKIGRNSMKRLLSVLFVGRRLLGANPQCAGVRSEWLEGPHAARQPARLDRVAFMTTDPLNPASQWRVRSVGLVDLRGGQGPRVLPLRPGTR